MQPIQCASCQHYKGNLKCEAFKDGIPSTILTGKFDHTEPYPDADNPQDNGIRFEPIEDTE